MRIQLPSKSSLQAWINSLFVGLNFNFHAVPIMAPSANQVPPMDCQRDKDDMFDIDPRTLHFSAETILAAATCTCTDSCTGNCSLQCTVVCTIGCTNGCTDTCTGACTQDCTRGCGNTNACTNACTDACTAGCTRGCTQGCTTTPNSPGTPVPPTVMPPLPFAT